ncbi:uncharacterized protein LOC129211294 [Grus americana]|uniref:uncharacterized protein LOC129211294 n=1 Tax=Grus americana TaxID=9117 RepID=UPI002407EA2A|nr:uncharacterized protein LOC129211294 [Grus americana]
MVQVQRAMALVCRLLLLLLFLLVALHARAARAAPYRARGADEDGGDGYPASELDVGLEPSGHPGDPLVVGGFPTSWPVPVLEPERSPTALPVGEGDPVSRLGSRTEPPAVRVGRPRAKNHAEGGKKSLESLEVLKQALEELEKRHETDQEAGQEQAFPEGSSGLLPPFVKETEAMQGTGMPALPKPPGDSHDGAHEFFQVDSGVVGERTTTAYSPQSTRSFPRLQDIGWHWVTDTTAGVVSLVLAVLVCCLLIRWRRKRKERIATALQNQAEAGDHPSRLHSQTRPESLPRLPSAWTLNSRPSSPLLWPYSTG